MNNIEKSEQFWRHAVGWLALAWIVAVVVAAALAVAHAAYVGL
jgi:hypothetical protein